MPKKNTRNARGSGMIRQRPNGLWEARYTTGRDPGTGKQIQKAVYGKTQKETRQKLQEACVQINEGTYSEPSKMTTGEWVDIWVQEYLGGVKPATAYLYAEQVRLYLKPSLGAVKLEQLDTHTIQGFYNKLGKPRGDKPPLSPKSIKNIHGIFHKALQQAVAIGYLRFNPSDACALPRVERKEIRPLEDAQITAFLKAIKGHRFEVIFTVDLFTGMREGEVLGLMWECIDFERGTILIDKQLRRDTRKGGKYYFSSPKNNKSRTLAPAPWVMKLLRTHRAAQAEQRLKIGALWKDSGLVFTTELGELLPYRTVYDSFKRVVAAIGTPTTRFHDLRHTYAVSAIRARDDITTACWSRRAVAATTRSGASRKTLTRTTKTVLISFPCGIRPAPSTLSPWPCLTYGRRQGSSTPASATMWMFPGICTTIGIFGSLTNRTTLA